MQRMMAVLVSAFACCGVHAASDLPLSAERIDELIKLHSRVAPALRKVQANPGLISSAMADASMRKVADQVARLQAQKVISIAESAVHELLPWPAKKGLRVLAMLGIRPPSSVDLLIDNELESEDGKVGFDYDASNAQDDIKEMFRAIEKSSFDLTTMSAAINYVGAGYWKLAGDTEELNPTTATELPGEKTPAGMMRLAVDLFKTARLAGGEIVDGNSDPAIEDLLVAAARDVAPRRNEVRELLRNWRRPGEDGGVR